MSSAHKKVLVRRFLGDVLAGYLPLSGFVRQSMVPLLALAGHVLSIPLNDIKFVCYVRDFNLNDTLNPERLSRRTFLARPRAEGLWLRLTFRSGDQLEGLAPTDQTLLDDLITDLGLHLTPPDSRSNTQRLFVPRTSLTDLQLLAVITSPSRRPRPPAASAGTLQDDLFDYLPPSSRPN